MAVTDDKDKDVSGEDQGVLSPPRAGYLPFDGRAKSMRVSKEVNDRQLIDEVYGRLGDRDRYEVVLAGDDGDRVLYVLGEADMRTVRGAVDSHVPDPHYGLSEEERRLAGLRRRLHDGEDLSSPDLNALLRTLL